MLQLAEHVSLKDFLRAAAVAQVEGHVDRLAVFPPPRPALLAIHQLQHGVGVFQSQRQGLLDSLGQWPVESEPWPSVVTVFIRASSGACLDADDAEGSGVFELSMKDPRAQPFSPHAAQENLESILDDHHPGRAAFDVVIQTVATGRAMAGFEGELSVERAKLYPSSVGCPGQTGILPGS